MLDRKSCKKMLVWDDENDAVERIVVHYMVGDHFPWITITYKDEQSFMSGGLYSTSKYKHAKPIPERQYVPWESIDDIPDEFFDGWVKSKVDKGRLYKTICVCCRDLIIQSGQYDLKEFFEYFTWSPTFRGEYKPCGKLVEKK